MACRIFRSSQLDCSWRRFLIAQPAKSQRTPIGPRPSPQRPKSASVAAYFQAVIIPLLKFLLTKRVRQKNGPLSSRAHARGEALPAFEADIGASDDCNDILLRPLP